MFEKQLMYIQYEEEFLKTNFDPHGQKAASRQEIVTPA